MTDIIIAAVVIVIVGAAVFYIYKSKKSGKKCIGCPYSCSCESKNKNNTYDCDYSSKTE